ncbi:MAG TPA: TrmH family RNA methyltransferase [Solirubrobacterales bacterium]
MITSPHNEKLKRIRSLHRRRARDRSGLFVAEGEDLVEAAARAGMQPELLLVADADVEAALLDSVSALGSGTRVIGVYRQRWALAPGAGPAGTTPRLSVYLHAVRDPGNVGTILRTAHALCDGPVVLGPACADPYSPKAVRASMGSVFARPPARAELAELPGAKVALDAGADATIAELDLEPPLVICVGAEREGLADVGPSADAAARIPMRPDGPNSLNAAVAAAVAMHEVANRMAGHA